MKKTFLFFIILLLPRITFWTGIESKSNTWETIPIETNIHYTLDISNEIEKEYKDAISINSMYKIDLTHFKTSMEILYPEKEFIFQWNMKWIKSQSWVIFEKVFKEKWEKELELIVNEIIQTNTDSGAHYTEEKVLLNKIYPILVFEKSFFLIYSDEIEKTDIDNYIEFSKKDGVFINKIGPLTKTDVEISSIMNNIEKYEKEWWLKSDFITFRWSRDFIFNILSKISWEIQANKEFKFKKLNIISISSFNLNILENYLKNFLANKPWLDKIILLNENAKYIILNQNLIDDLKWELTKNKYNFIDVNLQQNKVNTILFISKFINNLSNLGYTTTNIYFFLIIPIILTIIIFFKHFVWLSPIWLVIPLFITLLFFKIGFVIGMILVFFYLCLNLLLSIVVNRYNLLYAPKMAFLLNINIVFFILFINIWYDLHLIVLNLSDVLYFIIFIIMSEKMINILISKDISEYKEAFIYTLFISIFSFFLLNINMVKIIMLAYPEIILILIPINFLIWKFSGLRITEYFRFKEIIKSIEE